MKKRIIILSSLIMIMSVLFCGCSGSKDETNKEEKNIYSIKLEEEDISPEDFFSMNDLKRNECVGKKVVITGKLSEITGAIRYSNIAEMDSSIKLQVTKDSFPYIIIDTSGLEDTVKNWNEEDVVCVEANISYFFDDVLYITQYKQENDGINITNNTTNETVVNFQKEVEVFNDIDTTTYQAIDNILQCDWETCWEGTTDDGVSYQFVCNQGRIEIEMQMFGETISNAGTYVIKDKAIIITYDNGGQALMRYTFENNELTYLGFPEAYAQ